jgi:hypothetical protein
MIDFDQFDYLVENFGRRLNHLPKAGRLPRARRTFSRFTLPTKTSKIIDSNYRANIEKKKYYTSMLSAQMEALAAARETANHPLKQTDELYPDFPGQTYPTVDTYGRKPLVDDIYWPPVEKIPPPEPKRDPAKLTSLNKEIAELRQQLIQLQDNTTETPDEANVRMIRTKVIITEVSHDKNTKERLSSEVIDEIQQRVEAKIQSDRNSSDNDVYQRNHAMLQHLMRRQKYSKRAYNTLNEICCLLDLSGNLLAFTGQLFDREYLNTQSDKYYKYVSVLTFMLQYQRLSKVHAKPWFKDIKEHDKDVYFFNNWQPMGSEVETLAPIF